MSGYRTSIWIAGTVIVLVAISSGPAVGLLSVPDPSPEALATGSADLDILSTPSEAVLDGGTYTDIHHLEVPEITANVSNVTGSPIVTASVNIEKLGFSRSSVFVLAEGSTGRHSFKIERAAIDSTEIHQDSYEGRLLVMLRDDGGRTVLVDEPIRVEVAE